MLQISYTWKLSSGRLQANADFEDSDSEIIKNQYVKLEPRSKDIFECSDILIMDSCTQVFYDYK